MQAEASADVAADHQLELKYQKQGQKYQKEVEELEAGIYFCIYIHLLHIFAIHISF